MGARRRNRGSVPQTPPTWERVLAKITEGHRPVREVAKLLRNTEDGTLSSAGHEVIEWYVMLDP